MPALAAAAAARCSHPVCLHACGRIHLGGLSTERALRFTHQGLRALRAGLTVALLPPRPCLPTQVSSFRNRNLRMPEDADLQSSKIKAHYEDGVLSITIPKVKEGAAPKKVRAIAVE